MFGYTNKELAAIGYCFGGTGVLELARTGTDIAGVISYHGGLAPVATSGIPIKTKILVLHGADDPFSPLEDRLAFEKEMRAAKADWEMIVYGNTVHAFTQPLAGNNQAAGAAYNLVSDKKSWNRSLEFFKSIFDFHAKPKEQ